jgi:hypothetical protein
MPAAASAKSLRHPASCVQATRPVNVEAIVSVRYTRSEHARMHAGEEKVHEGERGRWASLVQLI